MYPIIQLGRLVTLLGNMVPLMCRNNSGFHVESTITRSENGHDLDLLSSPAPSILQKVFSNWSELFLDCFFIRSPFCEFLKCSRITRNFNRFFGVIFGIEDKIFIKSFSASFQRNGSKSIFTGKVSNLYKNNFKRYESSFRYLPWLPTLIFSFDRYREVSESL